ncbi:Transposon Ty3-I Gag-Pol polyprotein like [Argiope bruennichi]|uniref:Transposon Ty3-I Gag-Pol polyprotein like n=1 Tax=Argiope bruennichi TaxID=94029 RepID=A0A8T0EGI5_ARGBR|nr:Transposon Ty3-I Gag-Pol polyprotein like [Argiope bruennichi]
MVPKKGFVEWLPVCDYRALNAQTVKDKFSIPCIADFTSELHGKQVFSHNDLVKAFHKDYINPDDVHKTAICTPFGLLESSNAVWSLKCCWYSAPIVKYLEGHKNKEKHLGSKAPNSAEQLQWNDAATNSFNASKEAIVKATK